MEQARRPALADSDHRIARMGARVLINGTWYNMASGLLPKSPVSSSLCDEVPHIFIPKSHLEPREFLISSAKRLLQQYRHLADNPAPLLVRMGLSRDVAYWHIASFRCAARFGRYRRIADIPTAAANVCCRGISGREGGVCKCLQTGGLQKAAR